MTTQEEQAWELVTKMAEEVATAEKLAADAQRSLAQLHLHYMAVIRKWFDLRVGPEPVEREGKLRSRLAAIETVKKAEVDAETETQAGLAPVATLTETKAGLPPIEIGAERMTGAGLAPIGLGAERTTGAGLAPIGLGAERTTGAGLAPTESEPDRGDTGSDEPLIK